MTLKLKWISRNVRNYLTALAVLVVCAATYRAVSLYLLTIPDVAVVTPRTPTEDVSLKEDLADLFPTDAWQLGDCKRLLTDSGALLFQNMRKISEDQWKLEPLTIIVGRGLADESAESPIVLSTQEGAEIQFAESWDMMGRNAPPIKMGRLIGDVLIERVGKTEPEESLTVKTRNVRIDNQKVWTTEAIKMNIAGAELSGRDMTIYLAASAASATKAETPSTILDRMDLVYLEELRIPLDRKPIDTARPRRIGTRAQPKENGVVTIRCNNHVIYDFSLDRLSLRDSIQMVRSVRGETIESFHCDTLDLVLRNPADQTVDRRGPLDWIDRVHATGQPAKMILAPYDFELTAEEIDFDSPGGLLRAEGERGIVLQRGNIRAHLARLAYQYNPEMPDEIGTIDVLGAGNVTINDPEIMVRQFQWSEGFKLQPTGRATLEDVKEGRTHSKLSLRVDGDIRAQLSGGGTLTAGSIDSLLKPEFIAESPAAAPAPAALQSPNASVISQPAEPNGQKFTLIPEIFRATDAVSVNTNQVVAEVNELILYFEKAADFGKRAASTPLGISADASRRSPGALAGFVNEPTKSDQLRSPVARPRPSLAGDQVVAQLLVTPSGIEAKDVSIKGNVRVKHQVSAGESVMPLELTGDAMRLMRSAVSQASGQDYLQLGSGPESPARIKMGDGYFTGPMIAVWPRDNVIQVNGAGELKVPSEVLNRETANDSETSGIAISSVSWNSTPYCRWGGSMQFDGRNALLRGGVQIDAELVSGADPWLATMNGDEMQIALTQSIDLMNRSSMSTAEIAEVSLVRSPNRPVFVRAEQRDIDQSPLAIHLITADRLDFAPNDGGQLWAPDRDGTEAGC